MVHQYVLLQNAYGTPEMRKVWTEENMVQKWLEYEKAITLEMASLGMIPKDAAEDIAAKSTIKHLTPQMIAEFKADAGHLIVSFIKAFAKMAGPSGEHYHVGPTTQDILLTGMTLQIKEAYEIIMRQLRQLEQIFIDKAQQYKTTVMMGRTHGQHAVPITFGFLIGTWLYEIRDHIERVKEMAQRMFRCKLTAAAGTRNTWVYLFGVEKTNQMVTNVAQRMGLDNPPIDIGTRSDRIAEIGFELANITSTLGKIGLNIRFMQSTEISEVEEPWDPKKQYSSSTMPNKRNPEPSEWQDGLAKVARGNALALASITALNERDATRMGPYMKCLPENFLLASAALAQAIRIFGGLVVHADKMRENLYITKGIAMSEVVMLKLWQKTGKKVTAHTLVHDVSMEAFDKKISLKEALLANKEASKYLTAKEIDEMTNPEVYYGDAPQQVDRVVKYVKKCRQNDAPWDK
jgi:adenylosuccinate lyase